MTGFALTTASRGLVSIPSRMLVNITNRNSYSLQYCTVQYHSTVLHCNTLPRVGPIVYRNLLRIYPQNAYSTVDQVSTTTGDRMPTGSRDPPAALA